MPGYTEIWGLGNLLQFFREYGGGPFRVLFHPSRGTLLVDGKKTSAREYEFDACCRIVFELGELVFCVDEIWRFCTASWMPPALDDLVLMGRTPGVTLLYTAQRPQEVSRALTSQTTRFAVFRIQEQADLDAIRARLPAEAFDLVPRLQNRQHIARDEENRWELVTG
jgi:hypothetical protein